VAYRIAAVAQGQGGKRAAVDGEAPGSRGWSSDLAHGASEDVGQQDIHRVCVMSTDLVVNDELWF